MENKDLSHEESLKLINSMISKAKNSYHDTGVGPILWGSVVSMCAIVTYFQIHGFFKLPFDVWLLTIVAIVPQVFLSVREGRKSRVRNYEDNTMDALWLCFGIGIFVLSFISGSIINTLSPVFEDYQARHGVKAPYNYSSFSTAFFLLWYGFPTIITGVVRRFRPMLFGGIFCWALCIVSVFTPLDTDMLLTAAAAIFAWLIPGIILWKRNEKIKAGHGV